MEMIKKLFRCHRQSLGCLALAAFILKVSGYLIPLIDPSAGTNDFGIIQTLIFGFVALLLCIAIVFEVLGFAFPTVDAYIDGEDEHRSFLGDWRQLRPHQRIAFTYIALGMLAIGFAFFTHLAAGG